ncbi:MAG: hypothetical protein GY903_10155 [Fuerstiella sp.]|nr:hypothetical protein [Fuerstiella sp.]MCP4854841.1 hypothetical protein [Fuerstiella sp.]
MSSAMMRTTFGLAATVFPHTGGEDVVSASHGTSHVTTKELKRDKMCMHFPDLWRHEFNAIDSL